jgi:molecular chaperone GrpE (heat shock protein)
MSERRSEDHDYVERMDTSHASDPTAYWQELAQALAAQVAELQALLEQYEQERVIPTGPVAAYWHTKYLNTKAELARLRKQNERLIRQLLAARDMNDIEEIRLHLADEESEAPDASS